MARKRRMEPMMARAVAYDRLAAKSHRNHDGMSTHYLEMSQRLKEQVYRRRAREAAQAKEKKLFERDLKTLGFKGAIDAAKERKAQSEAQA